MLHIYWKDNQRLLVRIKKNRTVESQTEEGRQCVIRAAFIRLFNISSQDLGRWIMTQDQE